MLGSFRLTTLGRGSANALTSLCVSVKAFLTASPEIRREVFIYLRFVFDCWVATRNENRPDSLIVKLNEGMRDVVMNTIGASSEKPDDKFCNPSGIGGWLLIPLWILILQIFLRGRSFALEYIPTVCSGDFWCYFNSDYDVYSPTQGLFVLFETVMTLIFCAWSSLCVYLILKKSIAVRSWCSKYFITCIVFFLIDNIFYVFWYPGSQLFSDVQTLLNFLMGTLWPAIWAAYFLKSERVKKTFVRHDVTVVSEQVLSQGEEQISKILFKRCAARIIDVVLVLFLIVLFGKATSSLRSLSLTSFEYIILVHIRWLIIYDLIFFALCRQTIGKKLFGIQVIRTDGQPLTRKQYMYRSGNALYFLSWPLWVLYTITTIKYFWQLAILSFVGTFAFQYCKVLKTGRTSYDAVYDTQVVASPLTSKQMTLAVGGLLGSLLLLLAVILA